MIKMRKKGVVISQITLIILILITFVVISFLLGYMYLIANRATDREICKFSLLAATQTKTIMTMGEPIFKVDCKRHTAEINYRDVYDSDPYIMDSNIYRILQREMYECYNMIPEGMFRKRNPLSPTGGMPTDITNDPWSEFQYKNNICLICTIIRFDRDLQKYYANQPERSLDGFNEWLLRNPISEQGKTLDYILFRREGGDEELRMARTLDKLSPIDPSKTHSIVIRWKAQGVLVDFKIAAVGFTGVGQVFNIPDYISRFNTMQCLHFRDDDDIRCSDLYPILALLPVDNLGDDLSSLGMQKDTQYDTEEMKVSGEFCTVIWN